jgi:putative transposase
MVTERAYQEMAEKLGLMYHAHEFGPDHDHLFLGNCMKYSVPYLAQMFKGYSSRMIRKECWDEIKDKLWGDSFWSDGYFHEYIGRFTNECAEKRISSCQ